MKILADENIDASIVAFLRSLGLDVSWIAEHARGTPDSVILASAVLENRIVLTFDRDFGELVFREGSSAAGIILLRLHPASPDELITHFKTLWPKIAPHLSGHFIVATKDKIRIRPLPPAPGRN